MNDARLVERTRRAEQARRLAEELEILKQADPQPSGRSRASFRDANSEKELLPRGLLIDVIGAGRRELIDRKTTQLETLLGIIPEAVAPTPEETTDASALAQT